MFLRTKDYYKQVASDNLDQILKQARSISGDSEVLSMSELSNIEYIKNFISGRYRVGDIFQKLKNFNILTNYYYGDRINLTADDYVALTAYVIGDRVVSNGYVYECILNSTGNLPTNQTYWDVLGLEGIYYIGYPDKFDDRILYSVGDRVNVDYIVYERLDNSGYIEGKVPTDTNYWEVIQKSDYTAVNGVLPTDISWTYGDNRNLTIVTLLIDLCLFDIHSIINPRNIPELRKQRYDNSISFLKGVNKGEYNMDLPSFGAQKGYQLRAGSNKPFTNIY
jgi:hypothetical protein